MFNKIRYAIKKFIIGDKIYLPIGWTEEQLRIEALKGKIHYHEMNEKFLEERIKFLTDLGIENGYISNK